MTTLALAVALFTQAAATPDDLAFDAAAEESAMAAPGAAPPASYAEMLAGLGRPGYAAREAASARLRDAVLTRPADVRWLYWGRKARDPEVRLRCNAILRRIHPCPACGGTGQSRSWETWPCSDCGGRGTAWPHGAFDR